MQARHQRLAATVAACCAALAGCGTVQRPAMFAGFLSPQVARTSCVEAAARRFNVPVASVTPTDDSNPIDGLYVVNLSLGPGRAGANCSVNENGNVSDMMLAR